MEKSKYKILIIAPSWVGDMVMAQTLFKSLHAKYDYLQIDVFANNWALDILKRMPEVTNIIPNPFLHGEFKLLDRIKLGLELRTEKYDQAFILPNSFKSSIIPFFASIKKRTGFIGESRFWFINDIYKLDKKALPLMIDRFCALANNGKKPTNIPYPKLNINQDNQEALIDKFKIDLNKTIIAFCPAAEYGEAKRWPANYFSELANLISKVKPNVQILILGSLKDLNIANEIIEGVTNPETTINVCGKTNLADVVDLLSLCQITVTNDSGLMHIAAACNSQILAIYGSTSPGFTPPLTSRYQIVKLDLECSPCFERTCKFSHYNCLKLITPQIILQKLLTWL